MLQSLITTILCASGMAILLVEFDNWPMKGIRIRLQIFLRKLYWRAPQALYCPACTSFWAALMIDYALLPFGNHYFLWPLSGFATAGVTYTVFMYLNSQYQ